MPDSVQHGAGEERSIALAGAGSAGYGWQVHIDDPSVLAVSVGPAHEPAGQAGQPTAAAPPDAGSTPQVAVLRGLRPGTAQVTLELRRPWKPDGPPREAHRIQVNVLGS